ncbi:MAG: FecR domain-containing protein, partial [Planctomycetes bacterium]|nr:FecR domain-containing protein [Planctomycetota bacterium]
MTGAAQEIRHMLAGKPGGVNLFLNRWGKLLVDYATALIPDRSDPFAGLVEDLLVDAISQARVIARAASDDQVRDYVIESAIRTTRARYREVLDARNAPEKATNSYTVEEILARTSMTAEDITRGVSEGRLRAVRADNTMRIKGGDVPGLGDRANALAYHVSAAERELLCLHYRLGWTPEHISRISGAAPAHVENLIQTAAMRIGEAAARKRTTGPDPNDAQMRRYLEGRLSSDETSRFEQRVVRDKAAQQRLEELRTERDLIRDLFDAPPFDLSRVAVHVRERNPHQPVAVPPAAALWVQVVGVAALLLLLQRVGAYLPPPDVRLVAHEGSVSVDDRVAPSALPGGRVVVGQAVQTGPGAQATLNLDGASRVQLAQNTRLRLEPPRAKARQVLSLERGELWGRFVSSGHAYVLAAAGLEIHGDSPADFDLAVGEHARAVLPDNLRQEQAAALVAVFAKGGSLAASRAFDVWAGYRVGEAGAGVQAQDMPLTLDHVPLDDPGVLLRALLALPDGETARLTVRRGTAQVVLPLRRETPQAALVLRVFRGTLALHAPGAQPEPLNRGQWALVAPGMPPLIGQRGTEDYQLLRMDASERFKDRLHWLNVESFPLRAENSLLGLDRRLRDFAAGLERLRATEVQRDGAAEIARFEEIMRGTIAAARARLEAGKGQPRDGVTGQLSDEELVRAENEILGTISHWKRQATTGTWPTLGSAAKTLHGRIQRDRDEMAAREADMTQALLLLDRIAALDEAIAAQQAAMEKLRQSDLFDADGSRREELDAEITRHQNTVKAGNEARSRIELITLRLNELDQKLDDLRRKLPALRGDVAAAELALADIDKQLAANPYTAAALARLEKEAADAVADAAAAADAVRARTREQSDADSA